MNNIEQSNGAMTPKGEQPPLIWVVGLTAAGAFGLSATNMRRIHQADLLVGGKRHLDYFPAFGGEKLPITKSVSAIAKEIKTYRAAGKFVVVLASGDPLCYGIGTSLLRYFQSDALEITPAPSSFQLAFAALGEPWHDAALLSAHGRPLDDVVSAVAKATKAAILTDNENTPSEIAAALIDANIRADTPCAVCENLGGLEQNIVRTTLLDATVQSFAPLNVFVVWHQPEEAKHSPENRQNWAGGYHLPLLPDSSFSTSATQITKREIRGMVLTELALGPDQIFWDIGTGSGAISIEVARQQPSVQIFAVDKRSELLAHAQKNIQTHAVDNIRLVEGIAPEVCRDWPDPDAVFVGGSGGYIESIIKTATQRLPNGGRLVINLATIENLAVVRKLLPQAQITQVQIGRGVPIIEMMRFEALNPVYMVVWQK